MNTQEIECRFLEIDKETLIQKLIALGAINKGEVILEEIIIYDSAEEWKNENKFIRLRKAGDTAKVAYKEYKSQSIDGAYEIEFGIEDYDKAILFFERIGLKPFRYQQKRRHTFELNEVVFDIDTWPNIPPYLEIEGNSEQALKDATIAIGYNWDNAIFNNARWILETKYNIPIRSLRYFTFDRYE